MALLGTLAGMAVLASPSFASAMAEVELSIPDWLARVAGFVVMIVCFALFSGPSRFGADESVEKPKAPVDHLLPKVPKEIADKFEDRATPSIALGLIAEGRKIAAIKAVRLGQRIDLKDAKEPVEELQRAVRNR